MVANISAEETNMPESVSTMRFAMRVACITNSAVVNEQADPSLVINRLKAEIVELKAEIRLLKGGAEPRESLEPGDIEECRAIVAQFLESRDPSFKIVLSDMMKIQECFFQLKRIVGEGGHAAGTGSDAQYVNGAPVNDPEEVARLKMLVKQRDNEIAILLGHINKNKGVVMGPTTPMHPTEEAKRPPTPPGGSYAPSIGSSTAAPTAMSEEYD
jgi:kinesin family protein 6/9